jgi:ppGpp synthetase/RelA/SpoT-type nucleotidyltranferase
MSHKVPIGFKLKTKAWHYWDRANSKVTNVLFLASNREAVRRIKERLPHAKYRTRRITLTAVKYQLEELLKKTLVSTGELKRVPNIYTRVKTFESMNQKIERILHGLDQPETMSQMDLHKVKETARTSEDIPLMENGKQIQEKILQTINELEENIKKPEKEQGIHFSPETLPPLRASIMDRILNEAMGMRIFVDDTKQCYSVEDVLKHWAEKHGGRLRKRSDYIKTPTEYGYRSIHLMYLLGTVPIEFQIRTWEMQREVDKIDAERKRKEKAKRTGVKKFIPVQSGAKIRKQKNGPERT